MKSPMIFLLTACVGLFSLPFVSAEVRLPFVYSDHMVLQRDLPVIVRGTADRKEEVWVTFRGEKRRTIPDKSVRWEVALSPGAAGGPFVLEVLASNSIRFSDVLVGDIWVASGQSNMEFFTAGAVNATEELKAANLPNIRLLRISPATSPFRSEERRVGKECRSRWSPH